MKKIFILLLTCCTIFAHGDSDDGHSHDKSYSAIGFIDGTVINFDNKNKIEYASVSIYDLNSDDLISGSITDAEGYFSIDKVNHSLSRSNL